MALDQIPLGFPGLPLASGVGHQWTYWAYASQGVNAMCILLEGGLEEGFLRGWWRLRVVDFLLKLSCPKLVLSPPFGPLFSYL